jgi:hypothetical protein
LKTKKTFFVFYNNQKIVITTIDSLLREGWRYETGLLKFIFKFLFIPVYEDKQKKYRYIEALPKPGTTYIYIAAFNSCSSLQSVTISNSVTNIERCAFSYCDSLQSITISNSVKTISGSAFCACSSLQSVTIPNSITNIERCAFSYCDSLQSVTIPNSVTSIGDYAFSRCKKLNQVSIPDHLERRVKSIPQVFPKKTKIIIR